MNSFDVFFIKGFTVFLLTQLTANLGISNSLGKGCLIFFSKNTSILHHHTLNILNVKGMIMGEVG